MDPLAKHRHGDIRTNCILCFQQENKADWEICDDCYADHANQYHKG
jgi:hypothetical protein